MAACIFRSFLCAFIFAISSAISLSQDFSGVIARNSLASDFEGQKRLEALGGITGANYVKTSHLSVEGGDATAISGRIWIPEKTIVLDVESGDSQNVKADGTISAPETSYTNLFLEDGVYSAGNDGTYNRIFNTGKHISYPSICFDNLALETCGIIQLAMRQLQLRRTSFSNQNDVINMAVADEDIDSLKGLASATDSFSINLRSIGYSLNAKMRENGLVEEISLASSDGGTRHTIKNEFLKDAPELPEFKTKDMLADALSKDNVRKYWGFDLVKDGAETKIKFSDKYAQYLYSGLADIFGKNHKILSLNGKDAGSLSESGMKKILDDAETIDISFLAGGKQIAHSFRRLTGGEMQMLFIAMRTNYDPRGFFEDN